MYDFFILYSYSIIFLFILQQFMQKKSLYAFTLVEIVVVVSLLAFLVIFWANLNFSRLTQKQETSIETQKIKSIFDEVRNAAYFGRAVGANNNIIPTSWRIQISRSASGTLQSSYLSGSTWISYGKNWSAKTPYEIRSIGCKNLTGTLTWAVTGNNTGTLLLTGSQLSFSGVWCTNQNLKIFTLELKNRDYSEFLELNTVTWVLRTH